MTTPPEAEEAVLTLSLTPFAIRLQQVFGLAQVQSTQIGDLTIQPVLGDNGMSNRYGRLLRLGANYTEEGLELVAVTAG